MSILACRDTAFIVQGITGRFGTYYTGEMLGYGTRIVAGVTPGKAGERVHDLPVYDTVAEAQANHRVDGSIVLVPPASATDAIFEALQARLSLIVCLVDGVPLQDTLLIKQRLKNSHTTLIGPNCPGFIVPGETNVGFMPPDAYMPGAVGIISRSGTLTYQTASLLTRSGLGQSTCIGIGGDPVVGTGFIDLLKKFDNDSQTRAVVLVGEIGGTQEEQAADFIRQQRFRKPVIAFIAGRSAPPGRKMGHAGALIAGERGTFQHKVDALQAAGVRVAKLLTEIPEFVKQALESTQI